MKRKRKKALHITLNSIKVTTNTDLVPTRARQDMSSSNHTHTLSSLMKQKVLKNVSFVTLQLP